MPVSSKAKLTDLSKWFKWKLIQGFKKLNLISDPSTTGLLASRNSVEADMHAFWESLSGSQYFLKLFLYLFYSVVICYHIGSLVLNNVSIDRSGVFLFFSLVKLTF